MLLFRPQDVGQHHEDEYRFEEIRAPEAERCYVVRRDDDADRARQEP